MTKEEYKELFKSVPEMDEETRKNNGVYYYEEFLSLRGTERDSVKFLIDSKRYKPFSLPSIFCELKNLLAIDGSFNVMPGAIVPKIEYVSGNFEIDGSSVNLESLRWVDGSCFVSRKNHLPNLTSVGQNCHLNEGVKVPKLESVRGACYVGADVVAPSLRNVGEKLIVFDPESFIKGRDFLLVEKSSRIEARAGIPGEEIETILSDGTKETKNVAKEGDMVVNNVGSSEKWIIDGDTFRKKYQPDQEQPGQYKPVGLPMRAYRLDIDISITSPWGEKQLINKGGYLLQDTENHKDIYGIGKEEFEKTYRPCVIKKQDNEIVIESYLGVNISKSDYDKTLIRINEELERYAKIGEVPDNAVISCITGYYCGIKGIGVESMSKALSDAGIIGAEYNLSALEEYELGVAARESLEKDEEKELGVKESKVVGIKR